MKAKLIPLLFFIFLAVFPFSFADFNDEVEAEIIDNQTIGYYQTNTCKISLIEFYFKNFQNETKIFYNSNEYADINCFGKITGLDKVQDTFIVSIGTNSSINLIIQSTLWILLLLLIPKQKNHFSISNLISVLVALIFTLQLVTESRFYRSSNILFDETLNPSNYYLVANFLTYFLISRVIFDILGKRINNIGNFFPYVFLIVGTFAGMNLNFYLLVGVGLGIYSFLKFKKITSYDHLYYLSSIFWILNLNQNDYFFDGDKLRGFTVTNLSAGSQIIWIIIFYFFVKGILYIGEVSIDSFDFKVFNKNLLYSGSMVVFLGILGSLSPLYNFLNFYIAGQNKRGMRDLTSVAGNAWRGFAPSAEAIGEFFGFIILIYFIILKFELKSLKIRYLIALSFVFYGLYRSNNFAALSSLLILIVIFYFQKQTHIKFNKKNIYIILGIIFIVGAGVFINQIDYEFLSSELLYEATLHHDFYSDKNTYTSYLKIEEKMIERDLNSILLNKENYENASTTYVMLVNLFTQSFNIPLIPNIVALISTISMFINRTEMWGIFIAKYSPNLVDTIFGNGPLQLNKYLYKHSIRLDVPEYKLNSLFLPHSSLLDSQIFFGILGIVSLLFLVGKQLKKAGVNNLLFFPTIYLIINFLKSDSIMYLHSFVLFIFVLYFLNKKNLDINE